MWGGIIGLIIQLIAGAVGGNVAGSALKQYDLGTVGNTITGIVGGGVGAQIIGALVGGGAEPAAAGAGGLDIGSIIGQIASGGGRRGYPDGDYRTHQTSDGRSEGHLSRLAHSIILNPQALTNPLPPANCGSTPAQ